MGITSKAFDSWKQGFDSGRHRRPHSGKLDRATPVCRLIWKLPPPGARQRRAISNRIWTACGSYRFEPRFSGDAFGLLIGRSLHELHDRGTQVVWRSVKKLFLPRGRVEAHQAMYDDLAWLALENAVYETARRPRWRNCGRHAHRCLLLRACSFPDRSGWRKTSWYTLQSAR